MPKQFRPKEYRHRARLNLERERQQNVIMCDSQMSIPEAGQYEEGPESLSESYTHTAQQTGLSVKEVCLTGIFDCLQ